jgi:predicted RNA-binding protein Jag
MKFVVKTSKTVEEALKEALVELNATEKDVEVEIIE